MIFLKKFFIPAVSASALLLLAGCSVTGQRSETPTDEIQAETSSAQHEEAPKLETEPTAEPLPDITALEPAEGKYIYDNAGVLSAEDSAQLNSYCETLYKDRLINAAVVTASSLGGRTPYQFAEDSYNELYEGRGSGLLLLINNDTNTDLLYRAGSCSVFIPDGAENEPMYWATRDIVSGNYKDAILRLMQLGEKCPEHVFDNGGIFNSDEIAALEEKLANNKNNITVLATSNSTDKTNEEIGRSYFDRHYKDGGFMLLIDDNTKTMTVITKAGTDVPAEWKKAADSAADVIKKGGAYAAVIEVLKAVGCA